MITRAADSALTNPVHRATSFRCMEAKKHDTGYDFALGNSSVWTSPLRPKYTTFLPVKKTQ
jgi:hypothetical protein